MKRLRLFVPGAVTAVLLGSLALPAAALPGRAQPIPARPASAGPIPARPVTAGNPNAHPSFLRAAESRLPAAASGAAQQPVLAHLAPELNRLAGVAGASGLPAVALERDGTVEVVVTGSNALAAARAVGARVLASGAGTSTVTVAPATLRALAGRSGVSQVALPIRARPQNADDGVSEGVESSGAQGWADSGNVGNGGAGIKIGIVDVGFAGLQDEIDAGHLANVVYTSAQNHCADDGLTGHGTAVTEIVHQMAPQAELYLYCIDDVGGFSASAAQAVSSGVRIVNSSLVFTGESRGDGYAGAGSTEQAVRAAREAGVLWIQASGNSATDHWGGTFSDANNDKLLDLQSSSSQADEVALAPGTGGDIELSWDQWPASSLGVTLEVAQFNDANAQIGTTAKVVHVKGQRPTLSLDIANTSDENRYFDIAVLLDAPAPTVRYDLSYGGSASASWLSGRDPARAAAGSVLQPASSPWVLAVGAADVHGNALENYSSRGPTVDGRVKPDLLGFDGVSSNIGEEIATNPATGNAGFYGTSAAAPHVAGAAALVLSQSPAMDASDLEAFLERRASPLSNPATNNAGHGLLQLGDPDPSGIQAMPGSGYLPLALPQRILDTRSGLGGRKGAMTAGTVISVPLPASVPTDARAVVLNLTGTGAKGSTDLSAFADTSSGAINLNLSTVDAFASVTVLVRVNGAHAFKLLNRAAATDAVIDLVGYFAAPTATGTLGYAPISANRLLDTRTTIGGHQAKMVPNDVITVHVAGTSGIPRDASAVIVNVSTVNAAATGYLMVYPSSPSGASSLNYLKFPRTTMSVATLAADGSFKLQDRTTSTDVVVDVVGYLSTAAPGRFVALPAPVALVDTRTGNGGSKAALAPNATLTENGSGWYGIPYRASALWTSFDALASGTGYLRVYAAGSPVPPATSLNYSTGRSVANAVIANLSQPASGSGRYSTSNFGGPTNLTQDVYGYFVNAAAD